MMNKALRSAWRDFQYVISQIDNQHNQITIFKCIQSWYFDKRKLFSSSLIEEYQLEEFIKIDTKDYPLEKSEYSPFQLNAIQIKLVRIGRTGMSIPQECILLN